MLEVDETLVLNVNTPTDLVAATGEALDDALGERPVLPPDDAALEDLAADFWATALWAARRLRKGDVFLSVDAVNGALKRSVVTLLGWHALAVDPEAPVLEAGRGLERWADAGALSSLELAYAHYDLRDAARALWETVDLFDGPGGGDRAAPHARTVARRRRAAASALRASSAIRGPGLPSGRETGAVPRGSGVDPCRLRRRLDRGDEHGHDHAAGVQSRQGVLVARREGVARVA